MTELLQIKEKISSILGNKFPLYLDLLRKWFSCSSEYTKDDFDASGRALFTDETVHCHNDFVLALLYMLDIKEPITVDDIENCGANIPSNPTKEEVPSKPKLPKPSYSLRFESAPIADFIPEANEKSRMPVESSSVRKEYVFPDVPMMHGLMTVVAWDCKVDVVMEDCIHIMVLAVRNFIKNILTEIITRRSAFRIREKRFKYNAGSYPIDIYLEHAQKLDRFNNIRNLTSVELIGMQKVLMLRRPGTSQGMPVCTQCANSETLPYNSGAQKNVTQSPRGDATSTSGVVCTTNASQFSSSLVRYYGSTPDVPLCGLCRSNPSAVTNVDSKSPIIPPYVDQMEGLAAMRIACSNQAPKRQHPVSVADVFDALQFHPGVISSHSVYAVNMARLSSKLREVLE